MEIINSINEYNEIIYRYKQRYIRYYTNQILPLSKISSLIANKKIHYITYNENLLFLINIFNENMLYFYTNDAKKIEFTHFFHDTYIEMYYKHENERIWGDSFKVNGYEGISTYRRMAATSKAIQKQYNNTDRYNISFDFDETYIKNILYKKFHNVGDHLPERDEFESYINEMNIITIKLDGNNEIAGFLIYSVNGANSILECIYIDTAHRGKGLSKLLMSAYINNLANTINTYKLWVQNDNKPALSLYSNVGYTFDHMHKTVYFKNYIQ